MNAPERARNRNSTTNTSGLHSRSVFDPSSYDRDDADLGALVQRASSRPPAPHAGFEDVHIPSLSPFVVDELQSLMMPPPLSIAPPPKAEALSNRVKAMIALPWTLLVVGGAAVAIAWPRAADTDAKSIVENEVAMIAPAVAEAAGPSLAVAAGAAPAPLRPVMARALAPTAVAAAQHSTLEAPAREARTPAAARAATEQPAAPAVVAAEAPSAPVEAASQASAPQPATAPNGTNFDAIRARIENGGVASAPFAAESTTALPDRPSRGDVSRALRSVQSAVDACTSDVGTATVRLTVSNDGSVTAASATGDYAGTSAGSCMADAVRSAHFPPFAASSMTISYPFTLR